MSSSPVVSWYVKKSTDTRFSTDEQFFAGTYSDSNQIILDIQLWNNRWGLTTVDDLTDFDIAFFFDRFEDSVLLDSCSITHNGNSVAFHILNNKAVLDFSEPIVISGKKNNGVSTDNATNFVQFRFIFNAGQKRLKDNDLKSLYFEVLER